MTNLSADERAERIIRSLKANSAEFVRQERLARSARIQSLFRDALNVAAGVALGVLLAAWLR
jgi:hypothetical protein